MRSFEEVEDGLVDGSTWPSSRDWEEGAAKAETAALGGVVAAMLAFFGRGGGDPDGLEGVVVFPID